MKIKLPTLIAQLGKTDVYLLDQIMKSRYQAGDRILDAGCGEGRNINLFINAGFLIDGIDLNAERINHCQTSYPTIAARFIVGDLTKLPYEDKTFNHILSSAVLHFARSTSHFHELFAEHVRVLKSGGTFFIRMTSLFSLEEKNLRSLGEGRYFLPDGTERFLITKPLIQDLLNIYSLKLLEKIKTVNVNDERAMAVLMFQKQS